MSWNLPPRYRVPLLALGFVALVTGVMAGLARFGWSMPDVGAAAASLHGPLLLCGFFGTVIALERAVAIGSAWAYGAPVLAGIAGVALAAGAVDLARWCTVAGSTILLLATLDIQRRQPALFTRILAIASACWCIGALWWLLDGPLFAVAAWWLAFLVLTIAAERLELSRFLPPSRTASLVFVLIVAVLLLGLAGVEHIGGRAAIGASLVALAGWLLKQDIARRTVRSRGLTRYIALCLLAGYVWLAVSGLLILGTDALLPGSPARDAALHALALGFVFSMVFGHAPIIVPAVLRVTLPYRPVFYLPLVLLHASLLLRVGGDAIGFEVARAGAMGNAIALLAFIVTMASAVRRAPGTARA